MALEHQCFNTILIIIILLFNHAIYHELILFRTLITDDDERDPNDLKEIEAAIWESVLDHMTDGDLFDEDLFTRNSWSNGYGSTPEQLEARQDESTGHCSLENMTEEEYDACWDRIISAGRGSITPDPIDQTAYGPRLTDDELNAWQQQQQIEEAWVGATMDPVHMMPIDMNDHDGTEDVMKAKYDEIIRWLNEGDVSESEFSRMKELFDKEMLAAMDALKTGPWVGEPSVSNPSETALTAKLDECQEKQRRGFAIGCLSDDFPIRCPSGEVVANWEECWPTTLEECDRLGKDGQCLMKQFMVDGTFYYGEPDHVYRCDSPIGRRSKKGCSKLL